MFRENFQRVDRLYQEIKWEYDEEYPKITIMNERK